MIDRSDMEIAMKQAYKAEQERKSRRRQDLQLPVEELEKRMAAVKAPEAPESPTEPPEPRPQAWTTPDKGELQRAWNKAIAGAEENPHPSRQVSGDGRYLRPRASLQVDGLMLVGLILTCMLIILMGR